MKTTCFVAVLLTMAVASAPAQPSQTVAASVRFDQKLRGWDGCGVNYVELAQSIDYE